MKYWFILSSQFTSKNDAIPVAKQRKGKIRCNHKIRLILEFNPATINPEISENKIRIDVMMKKTRPELFASGALTSGYTSNI